MPLARSCFKYLNFILPFFDVRLAVRVSEVDAEHRLGGEAGRAVGAFEAHAVGVLMGDHVSVKTFLVEWKHVAYYL